MGRKSAAKAQTRQSGAAGSGSNPPEPDKRSFSPLVIVAVVLAIAAAATIYFRGTGDAPTQNAGATLAQTPADVPEVAKLGPHPQENLPPLPFDPEPPARPMDVVRAAYKFAAEHPEVLSYVPCYCGCEHSGHRGNEDCFVTRRDAKNDVVEWEPHGMT